MNGNCGCLLSLPAFGAVSVLDCGHPRAEWHLAVRVCISLRTRGTEHLFICLFAICTSFWVRCLFRSFAHFKKLSCSFSFCWDLRIPFLKICFMWITFTVFLEFVTILLLFLVFCLQGTWDLSSWPGIKHTPLALEDHVLTTAPPGKSREFFIYFEVKLLEVVVKSVPCRWRRGGSVMMVLVAGLPQSHQPFIPSTLWRHPYGRKGRGTKEPLDESERGEWKRWLKVQHS